MPRKDSLRIGDFCRMSENQISFQNILFHFTKAEFTEQLLMTQREKGLLNINMKKQNMNKVFEKFQGTNHNKISVLCLFGLLC